MGSEEAINIQFAGLYLCAPVCNWNESTLLQSKYVN